MFIFPAVGLGLVASGARRVTDDMMLAAARALGEHSPTLKDAAGSLLPALRDLRSVAVESGVAVGLEAQQTGLTRWTTPDTLRERVTASQWTPAYPSDKRPVHD